MNRISEPATFYAWAITPDPRGTLHTPIVRVCNRRLGSEGLTVRPAVAVEDSPLSLLNRKEKRPSRSTNGFLFVRFFFLRCFSVRLPFLISIAQTFALKSWPQQACRIGRPLRSQSTNADSLFSARSAGCDFLDGFSLLTSPPLNPSPQQENLAREKSMVDFGPNVSASQRILYIMTN